MPIRILFSFLFLLSVLQGPLLAQDRAVPYWATVKADEMNMRVGPSMDYKILWVYKRKGLPIKVIRVVEAWRLIEDMDGTQGWVSQRMLSPSRSAIVTGGGTAQMRSGPAENARIKWNLQTGVTGYLGECDAGWCEFNVRGHKGWVRQDRLWGTGAS